MSRLGARLACGHIGQLGRLLARATSDQPWTSDQPSTPARGERRPEADMSAVLVVIATRTADKDGIPCDRGHDDEMLAARGKRDARGACSGARLLGAPGGTAPVEWRGLGWCWVWSWAGGPSAATAGELVMNIGTPAAGAVIVCRSRAPSRLLTVPSSCPSATVSPGLTTGSHQPSSSQRSHRKRSRKAGGGAGLAAGGGSAMPRAASTPSRPRTCASTAARSTRPQPPASAVIAAGRAGRRGRGPADRQDRGAACPGRDDPGADEAGVPPVGGAPWLVGGAPG